WEIPRLCRRGSKSLTSSGVTVGSPGKDPSPVPRRLGKARGAVHPLPAEREKRVFSAWVRAMIFPLSRGERVAEGRGRVRGLSQPQRTLTGPWDSARLSLTP